MTPKDMFLRRKQHELTQGRISRRSFMTSAIAAGLAVPTALSLANAAMAATPNKGGLLRLGSAAGPPPIPSTWPHTKAR